MTARRSSASRPVLVPEDETRLARLRRRAGRHWAWGRSEGLARLLEEDQLNPLERVPAAYRRWAWRRSTGSAPGTARAVFLLGVQRSGTNMLVRGLERAPEFEVHNENDRRAFDRFRLRSADTVSALVTGSRHRYVLFKPLCDSHRARELLEDLPLPVRPAVVWAYRDVDGRTRSALRKFGDVNLRVLREIARGGGRSRWQAQGLGPETFELLASFDYDTMTAESAAALFWLIRNSLFFTLGLDARDDVFLSSYDLLLADPQRQMRGLCAFLGFPYRPQLVAHVADRAGGGQPAMAIDPRIRAMCDDLAARLAVAAAAAQDRAAVSPPPAPSG